MAGAPAAAVVAGGEAGNLLANLLRDQENKMGRFDPELDNLEACVEKTLRKRAITVERPFNLLNQAVLKVPFIWPILISNEGMTATVAIQGFLRSFASAPPHLVSQMCQLVHTMANLLAIGKSKTVKDGVVYEALLPLLVVLGEMLTYCTVKAAGKSAAATASIVDECMSTTKLPVERLLDKDWKKDRQRGQKRQLPKHHRDNRRDFRRNRYDDDYDE